MELSYDDYAAIGASLIGIVAAQYAMGHASTTTTAIYAATSDADLDVIAEAVAR